MTQPLEGEERRWTSRIEMLRSGPFEETNTYLPICFSGDDIVGKGIAKDLSLGGLGILSEDNPEVSACLTLLVSVPAESTPIIIKRAIVRWSENNSFGVEIVQVGKSEKKRLVQYIKFLHSLNPLG